MIYAFLLLSLVLHIVPAFAEPTPNIESNIIAYLPSIGQGLWFILGLVSLRYKPTTHYCIFSWTVPHNMLVFYTMYSSWWIGYNVYAFLSPDMFFHMGILAAVTVSLALLPLSRGSFYRISQRNHTAVHRTVGIAAILSTLIKTATVAFYNYDLFFKIFDNEGTGVPLAGTISAIFTILSPFPLLCKASRHEIFVIFHRVFALGICVSVFVHGSTSLYYIIPSCIFYLLEVSHRYWNTFSGLYTYVRRTGEQSYITFSITLDVKPKIRPAGYYMVCFRNISMFEWHPFSLISKNRDTYTFCARSLGSDTWTGKLLGMEDLEKTLGDSVYIQGPFSEVQTPYKNNTYTHLLFCCSGIALATYFTIFEDIVHRNLDNLVSIQVVWVVHDLDIVTLYSPPLKKLTPTTNEAGKALFNIQIYNKSHSIGLSKDCIPLSDSVHIHNEELHIKPILTKFQLTGSSRSVFVSGNETFIQQVVSHCSRQGLDCEIF